MNKDKNCSLIEKINFILFYLIGCNIINKKQLDQIQEEVNKRLATKLQRHYKLHCGYIKKISYAKKNKKIFFFLIIVKYKNYQQLQHSTIV